MNYKRILPNREMRLKILNMCPLPDKTMLKILFRLQMNKKLHLDNPITWNEKIQWLKIYDRKPIHTQMVDKFRVREIVRDRIGEDFLIPLLGVWKDYESIDFETLPDKFVLKCNHDSGSVKIVLDKAKINHKEYSEFFKARLKNNPYKYGREWPYKDVKPCIIAEKYLGKDTGELPVDYKFFCFEGQVDTVMICVGRGTPEQRFYFYTKEWKLRKYNKSSQNLSDDYQIEKPEGIDQLFELAENLSKGEHFVRIDFYLIDNHPYFGEFTFYPASGFDYNIVGWADNYWGGLINCP